MIQGKFIRLYSRLFSFPSLLTSIFFFAFVAGTSACQTIHVSNVTESDAMSANNIYEALLTSSGPDYLENEKAFMSSGNEAIKILQAKHKFQDPLVPLIQHVLLEWLDGSSPENEAALNYLDNLPDAIKKTPIPNPSPTGAAHYLKVNFQKKAAGILAVRLAKQTPMPHWRIMATLFYLEHCAIHELNPALIRFINTTENDEWRAEALSVLLSTKDPDIKNKIKAEERWLDSQNSSLDQSLRALLATH